MAGWREVAFTPKEQSLIAGEGVLEGVVAGLRAYLRGIGEESVVLLKTEGEWRESPELAVRVASMIGAVRQGLDKGNNFAAQGIISTEAVPDTPQSSFALRDGHVRSADRRQVPVMPYLAVNTRAPGVHIGALAPFAQKHYRMTLAVPIAGNPRLWVPGRVAS